MSLLTKLEIYFSLYTDIIISLSSLEMANNYFRSFHEAISL